MLELEVHRAGSKEGKNVKQRGGNQGQAGLNKHKLELHEKELELIFLLLLTLVMRVCSRSGALCHRTKHTHLA